AAPPPDISPLSLHDALPISAAIRARIGVALQETRFHEKLTVEETLTLFRSFYPRGVPVDRVISQVALEEKRDARYGTLSGGQKRSEEHTSELQSLTNLVCRL